MTVTDTHGNSSNSTATVHVEDTSGNLNGSGDFCHNGDNDVFVDIIGSIILIKNRTKRDGVTFRMTGMTDLSSATASPFLLRGQIGSADGAPAYNFSVKGADFRKVGKTLRYRDSNVNVNCWINHDRCTVKIVRADINEDLLSEDVTMRLEIGGKSYVNTSSWVKKEYRNLTRYIKR
ncbi:MAG: hypothetical protein D3924_08540 [Candidatus Electrothrix sp. AR4]|nr:hypothetical protein [Candidatus Electrothrix sp. AR4]